MNSIWIVQMRICIHTSESQLQLKRFCCTSVYNHNPAFCQKVLGIKKRTWNFVLDCTFTPFLTFLNSRKRSRQLSALKKNPISFCWAADFTGHNLAGGTTFSFQIGRVCLASPLATRTYLSEDSTDFLLALRNAILLSLLFAQLHGPLHTCILLYRIWIKKWTHPVIPCTKRSHSANTFAWKTTRSLVAGQQKRFLFASD